MIFFLEIYANSLCGAQRQKRKQWPVASVRLNGLEQNTGIQAVLATRTCRRTGKHREVSPTSPAIICTSSAAPAQERGLESIMA